MAKTGSWLNVRCGPVRCDRVSASPTWAIAPPGQTVASGRPATTKCPGRCDSRITASRREAIRTSWPKGDELQVPARRGGNGRAPRAEELGEIGGAPTGGVRRVPFSRLDRGREFGVDRHQQVPRDPRDDLGQLDRLRDVVDEVDRTPKSTRRRASDTEIERWGMNWVVGVVVMKARVTTE